MVLLIDVRYHEFKLLVDLKFFVQLRAESLFVIINFFL